MDVADLPKYKGVAFRLLLTAHTGAEDLKTGSRMAKAKCDLRVVTQEVKKSLA
jgi:hypothetical protein